MSWGFKGFGNRALELPEGGEVVAVSPDGRARLRVNSSVEPIRVELSVDGGPYKPLVPGGTSSDVTLFTGVDSTSDTLGFDRLASFSFNAADYPAGTTFILQAAMETTAVASPHVLQLYNLDTPGVVGTPLTSVSLVAEIKVGFLTVITDLPEVETLFEIQHKMGAGSEPEAVTCSGSWMRVLLPEST